LTVPFLAKKDAPVTVGTLKPGYEEVLSVMRENFVHGWEPEGCNFAAYVDGELVVDLWGGYADKSCGRLWDAETLATFFSCSKALTAVTLAMQADRGRLRYTDTIDRYWPEFAQNGKQEITVLQALQHQAGLQYLRHEDDTVAALGHEFLCNTELMDKLVQIQKPIFTPGKVSIYHALTFGWILDGLMRRVDEKGRSVGEFLKEEIVAAHGLEDVFIGGTQEVEYRIARIRSHTRSNRMVLMEWMCDMAAISATAPIFYSPKSIFRKEIKNVNGAKDFELANHPGTRKVGQPAANGVGNARNLAKVLDLFEAGKLCSRSILDKLREPTIVGKYDPVLGSRVHKGHGFCYTKSPLGDWQYGHLGVGGQNLRTDTKRRITFAYITNGMKAGQGEHTRTMKRLEAALYRSYQKVDKRPIDAHSVTELVIEDFNGNQKEDCTTIVVT
ncbi:hypothetical protein PFISCL1PPCAC_6879, partial [Pristionchus fissidentatus]